MENKKQLSVEPGLTVSGIRVIPIVSTYVGHWLVNGAVSFWGVKQPVRVLVISPTSKMAYDMTGQEIPLKFLEEEVPEIKNMESY